MIIYSATNKNTLKISNLYTQKGEKKQMQHPIESTSKGPASSSSTAITSDDVVVELSTSPAEFKRRSSPSVGQQPKAANVKQIMKRKLVSLLASILALQLIWTHLNVNLVIHTHALQGSHNDVMPQQYQHNNILYFSIEENRPNNTHIGTIRSSDGQIPYLVVPNPQSTIPESELKSAFNINFTSGDLTTNSVLDREHRDQYQFVAIVREPFAEIKCTVTVKDTNDNAPMFLTPTLNETNYVIDIAENQRGVRVVLPQAIDLDTFQYNIKEFRIVGPNIPRDTFHLVEHGSPARSTLLQNNNLVDDLTASMLAAAGADNSQLMQQLNQQASTLLPSQTVLPVMGPLGNYLGSGAGPLAGQLGAATGSQQQAAPVVGQQVAQQSKFRIDLEVSQPLDRENQTSYQFVVEAIDGGQPPMSGRLTVTVNVQDVNDNDPVFFRKLYECHWREDTAPRTLLLRVQASDIDLDSNGQVSYFIKRQSSSSSQRADGNNSTTTSDYNDRFATNKQRSQQQTTSKPTTSTSTGNNQQRSIDGSDYNLKIRSSSSSFGSQSADQSPLFEIDANKGEIYLTNQLDFETDQMHELLIEARDHGKPQSRSGYTTVKVHVIDVPDDPPLISRALENGRGQFGGDSSSQRAESSARSGGGEFGLDSSMMGSSFNLNQLNLPSWFAQMNASMMFVIVLFAIVMVSFAFCFVKIKSRQPESDYNDTAGLTLASNSGQAKPSPNHSASNLEHATGNGGLLNDGSLPHRHHEHTRARAMNGLGGGGSSGDGAFGMPTSGSGKMSRYQYSDSSNLYHNLYPPGHQQRARHHSSTSGHGHAPPDSPLDGHHHHHHGHQMAGQTGSSRGGTMTLHSPHHLHHPLHLGASPPGANQHHHHSLDHHVHHHAHHPHNTSSLTYAHHQSRAALLHRAHHHQSSHHLSAMMSGLQKGGTMNSVATHHSTAHHAHHPHHHPLHHHNGGGGSASPMPATPNTTHSSGLPANLEGTAGVPHSPLLPSIPQGHQVCQLPPTPSGPNGVGAHNVFEWPPTGQVVGLGSTLSCYPSGQQLDNNSGLLHDALDSCNSTPHADQCPVSPQPLDRWFDLGVSSQLVNGDHWLGSYNWDYLDDWTPEHHTLMPLIQADAY